MWLLHWLQRAVKAALHDATEAWATELGLPPTALEEFRSRRRVREQAVLAQADAAAAAALGVDDPTICVPPPPAALPAPAPVAQAATTDVSVAVVDRAGPTPAPLADTCPAPAVGLVALLTWVQREREAQHSWAGITAATREVGHRLSVNALRRRYRRWRDQATSVPSGAASETTWYCSSCGHAADEDAFTPSDGNPAPHLCPACGSSEVYFR